MLERIHKAQLLMDATCEAFGRQINIMEVCGTHTVALFRNGIRSTLPRQIKLLSGPGCPVCVTDQGYIDTVLELADKPECIIATYGDMIRVPGKSQKGCCAGGSLETRQNTGNVKIVLSSEDALQLARDNPGKIVVFVAVGFETTAPATAVAVKQAAKDNIDNFCILSNHKLVIPAMKALLSMQTNKIDAFLCPGHVSVIIGYGAFKEIAEQFQKPCVVAGFEPMQIIEGIAEICRLLIECKSEAIIAECFEPADGLWRGLGSIKNSTLKLKDRYSKFDAMKRFGLTEKPAEDLTGCHCGEVLCGLMDPPECPLFGETCTPQTPIGPCMVSSEGACAAWFKYGRRKNGANGQKNGK
ncbi:MAG: hydrogenase formation protein HypD [Sedimentisphaerales bacterium]